VGAAGEAGCPSGGPPMRKGTGLPKWLVGLIAAACLAIAVGVISNFTSSHDGGTKKTSVTAAPLSLTRTVTYMVTGDHTNQASITYETPSGTGQQSDVDVPLTRKSDGGAGIRFTFQAGDFVYISAQNSNDSGGVTCIIEVDGRVIAENSSSGRTQ
jgi:hypothetical protein